MNTPNPSIFTERPIPISWARASPSSQIIPSVTPFENPEVMAMYSRQFARAGLSGHHHLGVGDWFARALQVGHFFHLVACGHCCVLLSFLSFVAKSFSLRSKVLLVAEKS